MKLLCFSKNLHFFCYFFCLAFFSCKDESKPVTKEEAKDFSIKLEISVEKREADFYNEAIAKSELLKRANLSSGSNSGAFKSGIEKGMNMGTTMLKSLTEKGTYSLVKQYEKDNVQHLLFRLYDEGGLNYHDLELTRQDGKIKVADIFIYLTGQNLSESLRNMIPQMKETMDEQSEGSTSDEWWKKMPEIRALITKGQHEEALSIYKKIPKKITTNKNIPDSSYRNIFRSWF